MSKTISTLCILFTCANLWAAVSVQPGSTSGGGGGGSAPTGTVVNTVAPFAAGVPLVFRGTDTTNAVPGYADESITTKTAAYTVLYTDNSAFFIWNSATNCTVTFNDGATNGFNVTFKNLGAGSLILTNAAGKTFDSVSSVTLPTSTITHWIADGTNYRGGRGSPKNLNGPNTVFASPSDGSTGIMVPRLLVVADLPSSIPNANLASGAAVANIGYTPANASSLSGALLNTAATTAGQLVKFTDTSRTNTAPAADVDIWSAFITQASLTHAGTLTLSLSPVSTEANLTLTGAVTFATSSLAAGHSYVIYGRNPQITNCAPTFPLNGGTNAWQWIGPAPSVITASKSFLLSLSSRGTSDTNVWAAYAEMQ